MSWQISQKDGKYRIWSTVSDAWVTDWINRDEALRVYYDDALFQFKKKIIEQYLKFPHHWSDYDGERYNSVIVDEAANERYCQWLHELSEKRGEEYERFVDEMYEKVMVELNDHRTH